MTWYNIDRNAYNTRKISVDVEHYIQNFNAPYLRNINILICVQLYFFTYFFKNNIFVHHHTNNWHWSRHWSLFCLQHLSLHVQNTMKHIGISAEVKYEIYPQNYKYTAYILTFLQRNNKKPNQGKTLYQLTWLLF